MSKLLSGSTCHSLSRGRVTIQESPTRAHHPRQEEEDEDENTEIGETEMSVVVQLRREPARHGPYIESDEENENAEIAV